MVTFMKENEDRILRYCMIKSGGDLPQSDLRSSGKEKRAVMQAT